MKLCTKKGRGADRQFRNSADLKNIHTAIETLRRVFHRLIPTQTDLPAHDTQFKSSVEYHELNKAIIYETGIVYFS